MISTAPLESVEQVGELSPDIAQASYHFVRFLYRVPVFAQVLFGGLYLQPFFLDEKADNPQSLYVGRGVAPCAAVAAFGT